VHLSSRVPREKDILAASIEIQSTERGKTTRFLESNAVPLRSSVRVRIALEDLEVDRITALHEVCERESTESAADNHDAPSTGTHNITPDDRIEDTAPSHDKRELQSHLPNWDHLTEREIQYANPEETRTR
jgi:hypothetical protein